MAASEYVVNHGRSGYLGRFRNATDAAFAHGERVVVRSVRGVETGTILDEASSRFAHLMGDGAPGEILRPLDADDQCRESHLESLAGELLADAQAVAQDLGVTAAILDVEILLETSPAILHVLSDADCDLTALVEALAERHGRPFAVLDLRRQAGPEPAAPESAGCGKPGCGSSGGGGGCSSCGSGGGCSTGSCSSGSVKNAGELTAYFAGLRQQMETRDARVALHG
jgi:hypothetical protein